MTRSVARPDTPPVAQPIAAPRAIRQRRFRGGALALAVLLIALGGLLAGLAYVAVVRTQDVLAVARPVQVGTQITAADLRLPSGTTLVTDSATLLVHVVSAPTAEEMAAETAEAASELGIVQDKPAEAEGAERRAEAEQSAAE